MVKDKQNNMDRNKLLQIIEESTHNIIADFYQYQNSEKIKQGDISPGHLFKLEKLQNELTDLIIDIVSINK